MIALASVRPMPVDLRSRLMAATGRPRLSAWTTAGGRESRGVATAAASVAHARQSVCFDWLFLAAAAALRRLRRGRPRKGDLRTSTVRSVRLPDALWREMERAARARRL